MKKSEELEKKSRLTRLKDAAKNALGINSANAARKIVSKGAEKLAKAAGGVGIASAVDNRVKEKLNNDLVKKQAARAATTAATTAAKPSSQDSSSDIHFQEYNPSPAQRTREGLRRAAERIGRETAMKSAGTRAARTMGKATAERDAAQEKQVGERYKDIGPIISHGAFTAATSKKQDNNLTQAELDRKRRKR